MEALHWLHYLEESESLIVTFGLLLTAYAVHRDERARKVANMLTIQEQYNFLWGKMCEDPLLERVLKKDLDLSKEPVSTRESVFVKMLLLHLDVARRASREGLLIKLQGLKKDVRNFLSLPIPKAVWERIKPFQNDDFIAFIDNCLNPR